MKSLFIAAGIALVASSAVSGSSSDALHNIEHLFENANVVSGPSVVDCTLSKGTQTECFSITVKAEPTTYVPGPWCPTNISDAPDAGGIWLEGGKVYDVDGAFIAKMATFYDDPNWQLYDPSTGDINVTDTQVACEAAARPNVDPEYQNHCVQCLLEYMDDDATMTYVIPIEPVAAPETTPINVSGSGVALNGIRLDGPAPVDAILGAYTIAPFDDCGGHVNTHVGYHYHAVTDCIEDGDALGDHAIQVGIAMDGFPLVTQLNLDGSTPKELDECQGHFAEGVGYHYHAGEQGSNAILGCLTAETGCAMENPDAACDASVRRRRP